MSITRVSSVRPAVRPAAVRVAAPSATSQPRALAAAQPAPAAKKAQAAQSPTEFSDIDSFKKFVESSPVMGLPAARDKAAKAESKLAEATKALAARRAALGQPALVEGVAKAKAALDAATFPGKPRAAELRAEAASVTNQVATLSKQIVDLQQAIARAEGNKASRNRDFWRDDNYDGWDAVGDLLGNWGDASTINNAKAKIKSLVDQKVSLETKVMTLTAEAAAEEHRPGDPAAIAQAKSRLDAAQTSLDKAEAQAAPERKAVDTATTERDAAKGEQKQLEDLKADLQDYSKHFGFFTRTKLLFTDFGWKKDLDAFFKAKGL